MITAVDPVAYYRVGAPDQPDELVGHIIAFTWREKTIEELNTIHDTEIPNRMTVLKVSGGESRQEVFEYTEGIIGNLIETEETAVTGICVAGHGESWYSDVQDLAARIMTEYTLIFDDLNRNRNRPIYLPASIRTDIEFALQTKGLEAVTAEDVAREIRKIIRPYITLTEEDSQFPEGLNDSTLDLEAPFEAYNTSLDLFFIGSGLPPSSFGIGIGRGESGYAREKAQDAATARARRYRQDISDCMPDMVVGMGAPANGEYAFNWSSPPFQDRSAHQAEILGQLAANVITREEAREALGWSREMPETAEEESTDENTEVNNNE